MKRMLVLKSLAWILCLILGMGGCGESPSGPSPIDSSLPIHIWSQRFGGMASDFGWRVAVDGASNAIVTGCLQGTVDFGGGPLTSNGLSDIFVAKFNSNGNHVWSRLLGGAGDAFGFGIAVDDAGNVFITGVFHGTVDFGGGPLTSAGDGDAFAAKFDPNGSHLWSQSFGDSFYEESFDIAVASSGNIILVGSFFGTTNLGGRSLTSAGHSDIFVAKFDGNGRHLWSLGFGDSSFDLGFGVAVDRTENITVTGAFQGAVDFGGGPLAGAGFSDVFVASFDSDGNHRWSQGFGDSAFDLGLDVAVEGSNIVVTGNFQGTVDFGGGSVTATAASRGGTSSFIGGGGAVAAGCSAEHTGRARALFAEAG